LYTRALPGADSPGCRPVWMYPSYARITGFDETHTKFASKYSLYLYREQGVDRIPEESPDREFKLDGVPVLFIPGNAGSYRQARSVASESANLYFDEYTHEWSHLNPTARNLDVFTADFNEDFTAFHGRTMLDQAEYLNEAVKFILDLYAVTPNPPKSVIVVGHSMGGVVSRIMVSLPNFLPESINTIITLASPHAAAPLTFDGDLLRIYSAVDRFWYDGYHSNSSIATSRLSNLSLISITGGLLDSTLPADYTTLGYLVPPTNGFTVYTTGIPLVWTPIDHLAIVWCSQLRRKLARVLLEIVDVNLPSRTLSLPRRMSVFKQHLLTGFEDYASQDSIAQTGEHNINIKLDRQQIEILGAGGAGLKLYGKDKPDSSESKMSLFQIPKKDGENFEFSLLSSAPLSPWDPSNPNLSILLCSNVPNGDHREGVDDFTSENTNETLQLSCVDIHQDARIVPRSNSDSNSLMDSSFDGEKSPFHAFKLSAKILSKYDLILIAAQKQNKDEDFFIVGDVFKTEELEYKLGTNMFTLFARGGAELSLPSDRPLAVNLNIPGAWSSILAYHLKVRYPKDGPASEATPFRSFIRQWIEDPYESKWHLNVEDNSDLSIVMHGVAPFVPFKLKHQSLNIELWSSKIEGDSPMEITIRIDFVKSLRLLVLRYRLAIVAGCVLIVLLVMLIQVKIYANTSRYPNFMHALGLLNSGKSLLIILAVLVLLNPLMNFGSIQLFMNLIDPVVLRDSNEINLSLHKDFKINSFYLGLEEIWLWPIGIVLYLMALFLVFTSYQVLILINNRQVGSISKLAQVWSRRRIIMIALLLLAIPVYAPYQFVYIACFIIQIITAVKLLLKSNGSSDANVFNYQMTILMLMLWILPVNVPILIVFAHNIAVNWRTPFSSHHNFLSIIPIFFLIERNSVMKKLPKFSNGVVTIRWFMVYFIFYCIVYGIRHTFWIHHLFNVMSCLLLRIYYENEVDEE
ncbi:PGAP1-domain-containing protein, partial [Suhomyces tanzawaensis NRRL Y-17324]